MPSVRPLTSVFLLLASALLAHAAPPYLPPPKLVAQPEPQLRVSAQNVADYEFGRINFLDTPQIEHVFTFRNEGNAPATITQLQTACHCTSVELVEVANRKTSLAEEPVFLLEPGQDAKIKMTVQLVRQVPGRVTQAIYLYADGFNNPVATLRLVCDLEHGLIASPTTFDLGPLKVGETVSRKITLTYDPRLTGEAPLPPLTSQADPHIEATTGTLITLVPDGEVFAPAPTLPGSKLRTQTYTLTVKPTQPGDLAARVYFPEIAPADYHGTLPFDTAAEIYRSVTVPVLAQVLEK